MTYRICPICKAEMDDNHFCTDFDSSAFSIELELLGLPFDLEPYDLTVTQPITPYRAGKSSKTNRLDNSDNDSIGFGIVKKPVPLFLRL